MENAVEICKNSEPTQKHLRCVRNEDVIKRGKKIENKPKNFIKKQHKQR